MKKILSLAAIAIAMTFNVAMARPVDAGRAKTVANTFMKSVDGNIDLLKDITNQTPFTEFYVFANEEGGFVLVSGDDCVLPILGYSTTSQFDINDMPPHVYEWLKSYDDQIAFYKRIYGNESVATRSGAKGSGSPLGELWEQLENGSYKPKGGKAVAALVKTTWNQSPYYNNMCPYDSTRNKYCVTGCTATATAQVMKFWDWPKQGYGSHSFTHSTYGTLSARFDTTTYKWTDMPVALNSSSTTAQINAVATLMYHIGVAVQMKYSPSSSGAQTIANGTLRASAENALKYYFKYDQQLFSLQRDNYTTEQWTTILKKELDAGRPMIYTGYDTSAGHAFVCDGYDSEGKFHFNWGWGGRYDAFYEITDLHPGTGGIGGNSTYTFNLSCSAIIGIKPSTTFGNSCTITATAQQGGSVAGGGVYSFGDTVSLEATANSGYRFTQWNDGNAVTPRLFLATGNSVTLTAQFEKLHGDTLAYCNNACVSGFGGSSGAKYWSIKLPASVLTAGRFLQKVQMYVREAGDYDIEIFTGTTSAATRMDSTHVTFSASESSQWQTVTLQNPVAVDTTKAIWIRLKSSISGYPASLGTYTGNSDGSLWGASYTKLSNYGHNYSFLIKGIFCDKSALNINDTLSYCADSTIRTNVGAGGRLYWGVSFPAEKLTGRNTLTDVKLYVTSAGTYTMKIYQDAENTPNTLVYTQDYTFDSTSTNKYCSCKPTAPIPIDKTKTLWIVFYNNTINYPAAACPYTGDTNSDWTSLDGVTWGHLRELSSTLNFSWMIKAVTSVEAALPTIKISGAGSTPTTIPQAYAAVVSQGATVRWTLNGSSPSTATGNRATAVWANAGTYKVIATATSSAGSASDTLTVEVQQCSPITQFPYTVTFDSTSNLNCWFTQDIDRDGLSWSFDSPESPNAAVSFSWYEKPLYPSNWLVTPYISLKADSMYTLTWNSRAGDSAYHSEHYGVYVYTLPSGFDTTSFRLLQEYTLPDHYWHSNKLDLSRYAGQTIRIAFYHSRCTDQYFLALDDITVRQQIDAIFSCNGNGTGNVMYNSSASDQLLCGTTQHFADTVTHSFTFTPAEGCEVASILVNNRDMTNQATTSGKVKILTIKFEENTVISATFNKLTYTVTVLSSDTTMGTVTGSGSYTHNSIATISAIAKPHYAFSQWNIERENDPTTTHNSTDNPLNDTITSNVTYTAIFAPQKYTISAVANDTNYGTVRGAGIYTYLDGVTLTALPKEGYDFIMWSDGTENNPYTFQASNDVNLTAIFRQQGDSTKYYTITVTSNDESMGTVEGSGVYAEGTAITITAMPTSRQYTFRKWDDGNTDNPRNLVVNDNATYTAIFSRWDDPIGIDDVLTTVNAKVYPNPASKRAYVEIDGITGNVRIDLIDLNGRLLGQRNVESDGNAKVEIDLGSTVRGMYFIRISTDSASNVQKLIVE